MDLSTLKVFWRMFADRNKVKARSPLDKMTVLKYAGSTPQK